jgi:hypothetical protein
METWVRRIVLAGTAIAACPAVHAQDIRPETVAGCYDLALEPWTPPPPSDWIDSLIYALPPRVQLDTAPAEGSRRHLGYLVLRPAPGSLPSIHRMVGWKPTGDSLVLRWSTGFAGVWMSVTVSDSTLRGTARTFTDNMGTQTYTTAVTANRVSCSSPAPEPEGSQRPVLREVSLERGASVVLGMALDTSLVAGPGRLPSAYVLNRAPAGLLAGANDVRVRVDEIDGVVAGIRLSYPPHADYQALAVGLTELLGPPTMNDSLMEQDAASYVMVGWNNRTTNLYVSNSRSPSGEWWVVVILTDPRLGYR